MKISPERSRVGSELSTFASLAIIAIVICALFFGKAVLVPFALALLLSFLLTPPVTYLEKLRLSRAPAVALVLILALVTASGIFVLGVTQLSQVAGNLPHYQENIQRKIKALRNPAGHSLLQTIQSIEELSGKLSKETASSSAENGKAHPAQASGPLQVEVVKQQPGIAEAIGTLGTSVAGFIEQTAAVSIFTLFILLQRTNLRDRLFRLFGKGNLNTTTTAMDDAAQRISRYLLTQTIVNTTFGLLLGLGLYIIGVPNAPFWGVLGAILRYIPYVGTLIAGLCPVVLALAVFEGWLKPMLTFGLFATIELTISTAIEPWLYGVHTGISSLAVLVSAAFWTLLWGPIGLVLSTPLTVCLLVLGRYAPPLRFLNVLLGDQPVLPPEACYYQRLLALDDEEAQEVAENYLKGNSVLELYDRMLIPALYLAEQDRHERTLDDERERFIFQTTREVISELSEQTAYLPAEEKWTILCIPARDEADELVGLMLTHVLRLSGLSAYTIPLGNVEATLDAVEKRRPDVLFVSALPPSTINQARFLCRKVRKRFPDLKIMLGFWDAGADISKLQARLGPNCIDKIIINLKDAEPQVRLSTGAAEVQEAEFGTVQTV